MKILAFSDLHRDIEAAQIMLEHSSDADVIIGAGDFGTRGEGEIDTLEILAKSKKPCIIVHGNHDNPSRIAKLCEQFDNLVYLHGNATEINGVNFFGLGGEIPSRNNFAWNAAETEDAAALMLQQLPVESILVTHTPPYGLADVQKSGDHEGSHTIRDVLIEKTPKLALCGHIHNAWGSRETLGPTLVQNLGPGVNWFELTL